MNFYDVTNEDLLLIEKALETLRRVKSAHKGDTFHHMVGCAIKCKNGNIYTGVNENGIHGSCAEFVAMGNAITNAETEFDTVVAVYEGAKNNLWSPCGNCRQMFYEYANDIKVILNDDDGKIIKVDAKDLLPFAWEPEYPEG